MKINQLFGFKLLSQKKKSEEISSNSNISSKVGETVSSTIDSSLTSKVGEPALSTIDSSLTSKVGEKITIDSSLTSKVGED